MPAHALTGLLREVSRSHGEFMADVLTFRATVPTSGAISYVTQQITLDDNYDYYITELRCGCTLAGETNNAATADANFDDIDEISFNIKVDGTGRQMFTTDVELSTLLSAFSGDMTPIRFDPSGYAISAGKSLTVSVTRRATTITTQRVVTPQLICVMVPKDYHLRPE